MHLDAMVAVVESGRGATSKGVTDGGFATAAHAYKDDARHEVGELLMLLLLGFMVLNRVCT